MTSLSAAQALKVRHLGVFVKGNGANRAKSLRTDVKPAELMRSVSMKSAPLTQKDQRGVVPIMRAFVLKSYGSFYSSFIL
jgi:hypothetical protein